VPAERFTVELQRVGKTGTSFEVPLDVRALFGRARPPVNVTIRGHTWRSTVAVYGGRYYLVVNRSVKAATGVDAGDEVEVTLELDEQPREVTLPEGLGEALERDGAAREFFERLSFTNRREYADWIADAKREETRRDRTRRAVAMLREGKKHP
jgi:Bacteriocin-protection, YdeI or OmpD-Associated/Domain of unknown function (DUF1905)